MTPGETVPVPATISKFFGNPRLVECTLADDTRHLIMVQSKKNLRLGMTLKLAKMPDGIYELAQRLPRSVREGRQPCA
jgi:uncharacterized protein YcgL (UPF0745 family)